MRVEATALLGALLTHAMSSPALSFSAPPISRRPILASHRQVDPFDRTITLASRTRRPPRARKLRLVAKNLEDMISENSGIRVGRVVRVEGDAAAVAITCWREAVAAAETGPGPGVAIAMPDVGREVAMELASVMMEFSTDQGSLAPGDTVDWEVRALEETPEPTLLVHIKSGIVKAPGKSDSGRRELETLRTKNWVQRVIVGMKVCPFTQSTDVAATGLEKVGVEPGAIGYPHSRATSLLHIMGAMWRAVDEMLSVSPAEISTVLLLLPCYAQDDHPRFAAASNVLARSLTSIGIDKRISAVFFHPFYQRDQIYPQHDPVHGHLPPHHYILQMLLNFFDIDDIAKFDARLEQNDFSRRAPYPMINLLRSEQASPSFS